ncbi:MAG: DUF1272 domain-containing protein [Flavobacteriales bacterium]|nr:DUF1272 domain-containing protein [Flavobacteriales bacterium]
MLELRPNCENCGVDLPANSEVAMICSFECTFCQSCVDEVLNNVCPNCGGGFVSRPIRPHHLLQKYPAGTNYKVVPVDSIKFAPLLAKNRNVPPSKR